MNNKRILGLIKRIFSASLILAVTSLLSLRAFGASELLMFNSDYCTWCHIWQEEIGGIYDLTAESCQAPLKVIDFTTGDMPESLAITEPIAYTPTFVLMYDQQEVGRITGYPGADYFWVELNDIINNGLPKQVRLNNTHNCGAS